MARRRPKLKPLEVAALALGAIAVWQGYQSTVVAERRVKRVQVSAARRAARATYKIAKDVFGEFYDEGKELLIDGIITKAFGPLVGGGTKLLKDGLP